MACPCTTNAVCFITMNMAISALITYMVLGRGGGAAFPNQAHDAFFTALLTELSLEDSPDKESTPTTHMIFLGLTYDTISMTVSVPDDKLNKILCLVELWLSKSSATITELQSFVGKLSYICACICLRCIFAIDL